MLYFDGEKTQGKSWKHREITGKHREFWIDPSVATLNSVSCSIFLSVNELLMWGIAQADYKAIKIP